MTKKEPIEVNTKLNKCVIIVDSNLSVGLVANTAAVLALTLGSKIEGITGPDTYDASNQCHVGITTIPIPILRGSSEIIKNLKTMILAKDFSELFVVDFSDAAQTTKNYEEYTIKLSQFNTEDLQYLGLAIYGSKNKVNKLTGNIPLLR